MHNSIRPKSIMCAWVFATCIATAASPTQAQTLSSKGLFAGGNAVAIAVPAARDLVSTVEALNTIKTQTEGCAKDGKLFDPNTGECRSAPSPVDVEFTRSATTQLRIQRPDGSFATYNLDGADGNAVVRP